MLRSSSVTKDSALSASCGELLAAGGVGRTPRGGSTQRTTPRGLDGDYLVPHLARYDSSVRQQPPRFANITENEAWNDFRFRAEERKLLCPRPPRSLRIPRRVVLRSWVHVPWGNCASPSPPSREEGVALLGARNCNEVVPAHKEFLRARQTPVPLICVVCWVLACTVPGTRYMLHLEREA